jgi:hypothetical protein
LGQVHAGRGAGEALLVGHRQHVLELAELHD